MDNNTITESFSAQIIDKYDSSIDTERVKRKVGRPKLSADETVTVSIYLDAKTHKTLRIETVNRGFKSVSALLRHVINETLKANSSEE